MLAGANFLTELRDQAGCRYRVGYKPDVAAEFLRVESKGSTCGSDGFATGEGELNIMRSDGVQLRKIKATFNRGLPIVNGNTAWPIAGFDDEQNLLLLVGSDADNGVHYLAQLPRDRHNGTWQAGSLFIVALTEKVDLFRNLDTIRSTLMQPIAELEQRGPRLNSVRFYAMRNHLLDFLVHRSKEMQAQGMRPAQPLLVYPGAEPEEPAIAVTATESV